MRIFVCLLVDHRFASGAVDGSGPVTALIVTSGRAGQVTKESAIVVRFEFHGIGQTNFNPRSFSIWLTSFVLSMTRFPRRTVI